MTYPSLTKYSPGSIRELWTISFPLMLSSFAFLTMIFIDRCFLAQYSIDALNAAVNAGILAWAFMGGIGFITSMSEVFVAQNYGANNHKMIGCCVWQMIWIALFSSIPFVFIGTYLGKWIFGSIPYASLSKDYFQYLMLFAPAFCMVTALNGFFIGRGKTKIILCFAIFGNIINIILDRILIFGIPGLCPEMGIKGAAIATSMGNFAEMAILGILFFSKKNRQVFKTTNWAINTHFLKQSIRIGGPQGCFMFIEILGWFLFFFMLTKAGTEYITVSSICQSLLILFSFFSEGLSKGITAISANFIGANHHHMIKKAMRSGIYLHLSFCLLISVPFYFSPDILSSLSPSLREVSQMASENVIFLLKTCLIFLVFYLFLEGLRWICSGILTAAGDTLFLMIVNSLSMWFLLLIPTFLIILYFRFSVIYAWIIATIFTLISFLLCFWRYKREKWKKIQLLEQVPPTLIPAESLESDQEATNGTDLF